jgi:hypothetical protein
MIEDILKDKEFPGPDDLIQFSNSHRVNLLAGDYHLNVTQTINVGTPGFTEETWTAKHDFSVRAPRFSLAPDEILSVYPPKGSTGTYSMTLPHIVLKESTLPWQRTSFRHGRSPATNPPWLALIVLHPDDLAEAQVSTQTIENYLSANNRLGDHEGVDTQEGINVIQVDRGLLPTRNDLELLTHVRRRMAFIDEHTTKPKAGDGEALIDALDDPQEYQLSEEEMASFPSALNIANAWIIRDRETNESFELLEIEQEGDNVFRHYYRAHESASIIAGRLPSSSGKHTVHLVSLEDLYDRNGLIGGVAGKIELVSLYQWTFYGQEEERNFRIQMLAINQDRNAAFQRPVPADGDSAKPYLDAGFTALRHHFREGSQSGSWYHGPLIPDGTTITIPDSQKPDVLHVRHADQLMMYDAASGLFDVSYAAAWQIGRMLTLQNTDLALKILHWKERQKKKLHQARQLMDYGYGLSGYHNMHPEDKAFEAIENWLDECSLLQHIPFQYLVPDEAYLPMESIRFFTIDPNWMTCLRDGIFSIGRVVAAGEHSDQKNHGKAPHRTGFLLRSSVVSGFPQMLMTAYAKAADDSKLESLAVPDPKGEHVLLPIRKDIIGKDILLVLFDTDFEAVDFYLPPEQLHFGFDEAPTTDENGLVDLASVLAGLNLENAHSGTLADHLINGTDLIRFKRTFPQN